MFLCAKRQLIQAYQYRSFSHVVALALLIHFYLTGHDTTASGLTFALYSLAKHPQYLAQAQREVDEIFADKENSNEVEWCVTISCTMYNNC